MAATKVNLVKISATINADAVGPFLRKNFLHENLSFETTQKFLNLRQLNLMYT